MMKITTILYFFGFIVLFNFFVITKCKAQVHSAHFVVEEETEGSSIGSIPVVSGQTYRLSPPNKYFQLDENTGELRTTGSIDRESLEESIFHLLAVASESLPPVEISVEIIDINDNNPIFLPDHKEVDIPESTEIGTEYSLPTATDADDVINGVTTKYEIVGGDTEAFRLIVDSSPGDQTILYLRTEQRFNRENIDHYQLNISATDDGSPPRSGYLVVQVKILDNNDNSPLFDFSEYTASVKENATIGTNILRVRATDIDEGDNALVRYRIGKSDGSGTFAIDEETGFLFVNRSLDYETTTSYSLTVEAYDAGVPVLFSRAFVTVTVENINDNNPEIAFRFKPSGATIASVEDKAKLGERVAFILATDKDASNGPKENISVRIVGGNDLKHFRLQKTSNSHLWRLLVSGPIDRFAVPKYNLTFLIEDGGEPTPRVTYRNLEVYVNSPNDHSPQFSQSSYHATLSELAPVGSYVIDVLATDMDVGLAGRLKYRIESGNTLEWFKIEETNGLITTKEILHTHLLNDSIVELIVVAEDESAQSQSVTTSVFVTIVDGNDNSPEFSSSFYEVSIKENNLPINIARVTATDKDSGKNGQVSYSIDEILPIRNRSPTSRFTIDETSGIIRAETALTANNYYDLIIRASDGGEPPLSSFATVHVVVTPAVDLAPVFYPSTYYISEKPGDYEYLPITQVKATVNGKEDGTLVYEVVSGDRSFSVNENTGLVTVAEREFYPSNVFDIEVTASTNKLDAENPAIIYLFVNGISDSFKFNKKVEEFVVLENADPSTEVGYLKAASTEVSNLNITYNITDGDSEGVFDINSQSGLVTVSQNLQLDYEVKPVYNLTVIAVLHGSHESFLKFAECLCVIHIRDVNDNPPLFLHSRLINETTSSLKFFDRVSFNLLRIRATVGSVVYNASAVDLDSGVNSQLNYTIHDPLDIFSINSSGIIKVKTPFVPFAKEYVNDVLVKSCDQGFPRLCSNLYLSVVIHQWIGQKIISTGVTNIFQIDLPEDSPANAKLLQLSDVLPMEFREPKVVNSDGRIVSAVEYEIISGNTLDIFGIFPNGRLYLKRAELDREITPDYVLSVKIVMHHSEQFYTVDCTVIVNVQDKNDKPPVFPAKQLKFNTNEVFARNSVIGYAIADDEDSGVHGNLVYSSNTGFNPSESIKPLPFTVNRQTGAIVTTVPADLETIRRFWKTNLVDDDTFVFTVNATDNGGVPSLSTFTASTQVEIKILDVNQYPPIFSRQIYFAKILENSQSGDFVIRVQAFDGDERSNLTYYLSHRNINIPFVINATTGVITVSRDNALDREVQDNYFFSVIVTDNAAPTPLSTTSVVQVQVLDANDNKPEFNQSTLVWNVCESSPLHHLVGRVEAFDSDTLGPNSIVTYAVAPQNTAATQRMFRIEETSGNILLAGSLDRETVDAYDLIVVASDSGTDAKNSATATVKISVCDTNDNTPIFVSATTFEIDEGTYREPYLIGTVVAIDSDTNENAQVTYKIISQEPYPKNAQITVNSTSGELFIAGVVDRELYGPDWKIRVVLQASDNPDNTDDSRSNLANIDIIIDDINDNKPVFTSPDTVFIPARSSNSIGYEIATIMAVDLDEGANGTVSYQLYDQENNALFSIQPDTGVLELNKIIPSDHSIVFTVNVVASDQGLPNQFTIMELNVIVGDPNLQNGPVFTSSSYHGSILENTNAGTPILTVAASGQNVQYFIIGVSKTGADGKIMRRRPFAINSTSGQISNLMELDREDENSYLLNIVAVDMMSTETDPHMTSISAVITVLDDNDSPPLFRLPLTEEFISESAPPGQVIPTQAAFDLDSRSTLVYSLLEGAGSDEFIIDPSNGELKIGPKGLDRERTERYFLTIQVSDGRLTSNTQLVIQVIDVNDHAPVFPLPNYVFAIEEGYSTPPSGGRFVGSVRAKDDDTGINAMLIYTFVNGSNLGLFTLDFRSGSIYLNASYSKEFDREEQDLYVLMVRASDENGRFSDVVVFINIIDVNDNAPIFINKTKRIQISEVTPVGHELLALEAHDADIGFNGKIEYQIVAGDWNNCFEITPDTGILTVHKSIDLKNEATYNLIIMAMDLASPSSRLYSFMNLTIDIFMIPDDPPTLVMPNIWFVPENTPRNTAVMRIGAYDELFQSDCEFKIMSQSPDHGAFQMDENSALLSVGSGELDRETMDRYKLVVSACIKDTLLCSTSPLEIVITDINDNSPVFDPSSIGQTVEVKEDAVIGSEIAQVQASDKDKGFNGLVKYRLQCQPNHHQFAIDPNTGVIYVSGLLDYEAVSHYLLIVEAYDSGIPSRIATINVTVEIIDNNDFAPIITPASRIIHVDENVVNPTSLIRFQLFDNDTGDNSWVDFRSAMVTKVTKDGVDVTGDQNGLGTLFALLESGELSLTRPVDKEEVDSYTVVITASDRGSPPSLGTASVLIVVDDVNEFGPEFQPKIYEATIAENARVNTDVVQVAAIDKDGGMFGEVRYSLLHSNNTSFAIDPTTGMIFTSASLDKKTKREYHLTAIATDESLETASTSVTIKVLDVNDNPPNFSVSSYSFYTSERENSVCGVVFASDADEGKNGKVIYSIVSNEEFLPFRIDSEFGGIFSTEQLTDSVYQFQVVARDLGYPSLSATTNVSIKVNAGPYPRFLNTPTSQVNIMENALPNDNVLFEFRATATSTIHYYIVGGNIDESFSINNTTGDLVQVKPLNREEMATFKLWIEARGSDEIPLSTYTSLDINVVDLNDNSPVFSKSLYVGYVKEDSRKSIITTLSAVDPDNDGKDSVEYFLKADESEGSEKFDLNSKTGVLQNRVLLNREEKESYFLTVLAKDKGVPSLTSSATVRVIVEDINDNPPSFTRLNSAIIREDAMIGDYVTLVTINDPDSDENAQNRYRLTNDANGTFAIDPLTGVVTLRKELNSDKQSEYTLQVNAGDESWDGHTSITISVTDVNDNIPRFDEDIYEVNVNSGFPPNSPLIQLTSSDKDKGLNQKVFYSIWSHSEYFTINHTTGEIHTVKELVCSTSSGFPLQCPYTHTLLVAVSDNGKPYSLFSTATVMVNVLAKNMHTPVFSSDVLSPVAVLQSSPVGTTVLTMHATDDDESCSSITYSVVDGSHISYFSINNITGEIKTTESLTTIPILSTFFLVVRATDSGFPEKYVETNVAFEITGENLFSPSFTRTSFTTQPVAEDTPIGTDVATVTATDEDEGIDGKVTYALSNNDRDKPFKINETTGVVYTTGALDYETASFYVLTVIASDRAVIQKSAQIQLTIPIYDVNDNSPRFNSSHFVAYISENASPETIVTRLTATDDDTSENAIIHYGVFPQEHMVARPLTGDIYLGFNTHLDYEKRNSYHVTVMASDQGRSNFNESVDLTIRVIDENEFPPEIVDQSLDFQISVNSLPGEIVGRLNVTDKDAGESGEVKFFLAGWSENMGFSVVSTTGVIVVNNEADLKLGRNIHLTIFAKNPGISIASSLTQLDVFIRVITDECLRNPCQNGATCQDRPDTFACLCVAGYTGALCDTEINECSPNPCQHGGSCDDLVGDFYCNCPPGYTGKVCDTDIDYCEGNPCFNGGTCIDGLHTYTCECDFGTAGVNCEQNSLGFELLSYLTLAPLNASSNEISFEFATVSTSALLMYNFASDNQGAFVAVELLQGKIRLSYNFGQASDGSTIRFSTGQNLADGLWHQVSITIDTLQATVDVDGCGNNDASCFTARRHSFSTNSPLSGLTDQPLYVGGISSAQDIENHPDQVSSFEFLGCLRNLRVNSIEIDSISSPNILNIRNIVNGCPRKQNVPNGGACDSVQETSLCGQNAKCTDLWSTAVCECPDNKSGKTCQNDRVGSSFDGKSYLVYLFSPQYSLYQTITSSGALYDTPSNRKKRSLTATTNSSISVRFRTRDADGVIWLVEGQSDLTASLTVKDGSLLYAYSTSSIRKQHTLKHRIDDGRWRTVEVRLFSNAIDTRLTITLDNSQLIDTSFAGGITDFSNNADVKEIYVGGSPSSSLSNSPALSGCIYTFSVNDQALPLADDGVSSTFTVTQKSVDETNTGGNITHGCTGRDMCASNPCSSLGQYCNDIWEAYECIPLGECAYSPCLNGGSCQPFSNNSYECHCPINYGGQHCEVFIPCQSVDCNFNYVCQPVGKKPTCLCAIGYSESNGMCVAMSGTSQGFPWWIIVIVVVGLFAVLVIAAIVIHRYYPGLLRRKNTANSGESDEQTHPKGNGDLGKKNKSFNFDDVNSSSNVTTSPPLCRPDLLPTDVERIDEESANFENTSSGIGSTRSTTSSPIKVSSPVSTSLSIREEYGLGNDLLADRNKASKSTNPLPSYEIIMKERNEQLKSIEEVEKSKSPILPPYDSERDSGAEVYSTPSLPGDFFRISNNPTPSESSINAPTLSTISCKSSEVRSYTRSPAYATKTFIEDNISTGKISGRDSTLRVPYIPTGRISPTKGPNLLTVTSDKGAPHLRYSAKSISPFPNSTYLHRASGSVASSSTGSTSSREHTSSTSAGHRTAIEEMVQRVNGLIGLTNEEIELLNENPRESHEYSSSNSESESTFQASLAYERNLRAFFTQSQSNPDGRPSSLPGRRISRAPTGNRSRTPMTLLPSSIYKQTNGYRNKYPDLPSELTPSEYLQPPPDTSSDDDDYILDKLSIAGYNHANHLKQNSSFNGGNPYAGKTLLPPDDNHLDFLMSYGKNYQDLAGIFQDLAALPCIRDEETESRHEEKPSYSNSFSMPNKKSVRARSVSHSSTEYSGTRPPSSRGTKLASMSPDPMHSSSSSRPQSVNRKRQEHYV